MSTRGTYGFVIDGVEKLGYNHSDSYPDGLGEDMLAALREVLATPGLEGLKDQARALALVTDETPPTPEQIEKLLPFYNGNVGARDQGDWYSLLRETQGDLAATLKAGFMADAREFAQDSLFCEWGYVVDLDAERFEVYEGFQKAAHSSGRFCARAGRDADYYPIKLVAAFPFAELPEDLSALSGGEE